MTHLALHVVAAFLAPPVAPAQPESAPERQPGIPFAFLLFCLVCMALTLAEALWPPLAAALSSLDTAFVAQL